MSTKNSKTMMARLLKRDSQYWLLGHMVMLVFISIISKGSDLLSIRFVQDLLAFLSLLLVIHLVGFVTTQLNIKKVVLPILLISIPACSYVLLEMGDRYLTIVMFLFIIFSVLWWNLAMYIVVQYDTATKKSAHNQRADHAMHDFDKQILPKDKQSHPCQKHYLMSHTIDLHRSDYRITQQYSTIVGSLTSLCTVIGTNIFNTPFTSALFISYGFG